jgi:hypothetical protein
MLSLCSHHRSLSQVVGDRACTKEFLRLQTSALALAQDPAELAKAKPFAVEVSTCAKRAAYPPAGGS